MAAVHKPLHRPHEGCVHHERWACERVGAAEAYARGTVPVRRCKLADLDPAWNRTWAPRACRRRIAAGSLSGVCTGSANAGQAIMEYASNKTAGLRRLKLRRDQAIEEMTNALVRIQDAHYEIQLSIEGRVNLRSEEERRVGKECRSRWS